MAHIWLCNQPLLPINIYRKSVSSLPVSSEFTAIRSRITKIMTVCCPLTNTGGYNVILFALWLDVSTFDYYSLHFTLPNKLHTKLITPNRELYMYYSLLSAEIVSNTCSKFHFSVDSHIFYIVVYLFSLSRY